MKEAMLFEKLPGQRVRCLLCAHHCTIESGKPGLCGVRKNQEGSLYTLVYGVMVAENLDPIEKKPFFHVCPGSLSFSIASVGCNFQCIFCQNHEISQLPRERQTILGRDRTPAYLVDYAFETGSKSIASTYTEPTVFFEFALDVARLAREKGILNLFVTNGYQSREACNLIAPYLDAANVDLKSFSDGFYKKYCGARLEPVLDTLRDLRNRNIWIEITTLIIPTLNDSEEELRDMARFIRSLGSEIPWHVSRYHPRYKLHTIGPTPTDTIMKAREIGMEEGLKYVYTGNLPGDEGEKTFCATCKTLLIDRSGFRVNGINLKGADCPNCGARLEGIFACDNIEDSASIAALSDKIVPAG